MVECEYLGVSAPTVAASPGKSLLRNAGPVTQLVVPLEVPSNPVNANYLRMKAARIGHRLRISRRISVTDPGITEHDPGLYRIDAAAALRAAAKVASHN